MRGHDQTSGRAQPCAWSWLILIASVAPVPARAQDGPDRVPTTVAGEPVDLAAHSIRVWDSGGDRWVLLRGRAAVLQEGADGLRAAQAVIKITPGTDPLTPSYRLEVYAEGEVERVGPPGPPRRAARITLLTEKDVRIKPYDTTGLVRLPGPPQGLALLDRAFPRPPERPRLQATGATPSNATGATPSSNSSPPAPAAEVATPAERVSTLPTVAVLPDLQPAPGPAPAEPEGGPRAASPIDPAVARAQFDEDVVSPPSGPSAGDLPPVVEAPALEGAAVVPDLKPESEPGPAAPPTTLEPLPGPDGAPAAPITREPEKPAEPEPESIPIRPGSQRITRIYPREGGPGFSIQSLPTVDGVSTTVVKGGVIIVSEMPPPNGIIDISADSAVIWRRTDGKSKVLKGPGGEDIEDAGQPMEVYLEGNVIVRQDTRQIAGNADQKTYRAKQAYYDFRAGRVIALEAEIDMFAPGLIAPTRIFAPRIDQYRPLEQGPDGKYRLGFEEIRADHTLTTGSRFPTPGYRFTSRSIGITHVVSAKNNPTTGTTPGDPRDPRAPQKLTWEIDARQNTFYLGPVPVFFYPRFLGEADDLEPPLRSIIYRTNNYLGTSFLTDWNGFRLTGIKKPEWIDNWNVDIDYLQLRTKKFPALGTEIGWFGKDFLRDLTDPYRQRKDATSNITPDGYYGYFDIWGLRDYGVDDLGGGPAIITNSLAIEKKFGKKGYQRGPNGVKGVPHLGVPAFQDFRGRVNIRHMQSLLGEDADQDEEFRVQLEAAYVSDRYFLEEYYKRLNETGLDQETLAYLIRQKQNTAWTLWTEANLQNFNTETQWLPRLDYYRFGDAPLNQWFTYSQHSGVDYANTHTAAEVNNPYIFAYMPYDPTSNTSGTLRAGRAYTNHEVDLPFNLGGILKVVPYVQGQAVGWTDQIDGRPLGRVWGAVGARANVEIWKRYPDVESDLFNVHGLNNKVNFMVDYRDAFSNVRLDQVGIQDDLDDNTYEGVRRFFALTNYVGGVLPPQYDPRHLILRRALSPISGPTDVQASLHTVQFNMHQRLQTKRGPVGRRRVIDYMTLDATTTYFPQAQRDDFGKPFGQNMYNWQWFLGDRTSIVSYGWFEFFKIAGNQLYSNNVARHNNPFGLNVITSGISINRPPRGNIYIGYTILDTGPINTSALNTSFQYWLSPKWYGTYSNSYDFGNAIALSSYFALTRIGADYLLSVGLSVDPQRNSYMFAFLISPRLSPNIRLGSGLGTTGFDSRFAPTQ